MKKIKSVIFMIMIFSSLLWNGCNRQKNQEDLTKAKNELSEMQKKLSSIKVEIENIKEKGKRINIRDGLKIRDDLKKRIDKDISNYRNEINNGTNVDEIIKSMKITLESVNDNNEKVYVHDQYKSFLNELEKKDKRVINWEKFKNECTNLIKNLV